MAREVEAKFRNIDPEALVADLRRLGAHPAGCFFEENILLDTADARLRQRGEGLRIRMKWPLGDARGVRQDEAGAQQEGATATGQGGHSAGSLTFKGRVASGPFKVREELEFGLADAQTALEMFARLGYHPILRFEKRRQTWEWAGCRVEMDVVPYLGRFVEVEATDEAALASATQTLGLGRGDLESRTYVAMLMDLCQERGLDPLSVRFERGAQEPFPMRL